MKHLTTIIATLAVAPTIAIASTATEWTMVGEAESGKRLLARNGSAEKGHQYSGMTFAWAEEGVPTDMFVATIMTVSCKSGEGPILTVSIATGKVRFKGWWNRYGTYNYDQIGRVICDVIMD